MLGMIYTEFLEMVEQRFGEDAADRMLDEVSHKLPSGGAYTAVGNYDHSEIIILVMKLSEMAEIPVPTLVSTFGSHLFHRFGHLYPQLFGGTDNTLDFLEQVEDYIHRQVHALYPKAELPTFVCSRSSDNELIMDYRSKRAFGDLAHGLILGCAQHFNENVTVTSTPLEGELSGARFVIIRHD